MYEKKFSKWTKWQERGSIFKDDTRPSPGVYVCALAGSGVIHGSDFHWTSQIIYIGMTNSVGGLRSRLNQFDNTIDGKTGHGGADRVRYAHPNYQKLVAQLLVSVAKFRCDVKSQQSKDLLIMGEVAKFEYVCVAEFEKTHHKLPDFYDKKSKKYSREFGRDT